ncbi:MAG: hypothetical protein IPL79_02075 [Myxococcales bacterium]|nr:hypothetical protein [Myxococcales bacterium]
MLTTTCENQRLIDNHGPGVVNVVGLTLTGGHASYGGAIRSQVAPLSLESVTFRGNNATYGGAVWVSKYEFIVRNSWFEGNHATDAGGAISMIGTTSTISNTSFFQNSSDENGGAIHTSASASLLMTDSVIEGNSAKEGGGLYGVNLNATVANSKFRLNYAFSDVQGYNGNGGGAFLYCTTVGPFWIPRAIDLDPTPTYLPDCATSFVDTDFEVNVVDGTSSASGGAIWAWQNVVNFDGCKFIGNYAQGSGGALKLRQSHSKMVDNLFYVNAADVSAGALDAVEFSYIISRDNRFLQNSAESLAGAVFVRQNTIGIFNGDRFEGNVAVYNGALSTQSDSRVTIRYATFFANVARSSCGAIGDINAEYVQVHWSTFEQNSVELADGALSGNGGAVCGQNLLMYDSHVFNNSANLGGGISGSIFGTAQIYRTTVEGNHAASSGGGAWGNLNIYSSTFTGNTSEANRGAAINVGSGYRLYLYNSTIALNGTAEIWGGDQLRVTGEYTLHGNYVGNAPGNVKDCYVKLGTTSTQPFTNNYDTDGTCQLPIGGGNVSGGADAIYGALGYFGGFAPTLQMYANSPIVDAYSCPLGISDDQRGRTRPQLQACDYGATEFVYSEENP